MGQAGIPAVSMMNAVNGELSSEIERKFFTVYPFIESDRSHVYSNEDYFRMGEMLARIHLVSRNSIPSDMQLGHMKNNGISETIIILKSHKDRILSKSFRDEADDLFLEYILLKLDILETMEDSGGIYEHRPHLLHGDYHAGNLLIDGNTREIVGVCDWEKAEVGSRACEIARSALIIFENFDAAELASLNSYLEGYGSVYPISRQELVEGFQFRAKAMVKSKWMEDAYYNKGDPRSNYFIVKDMKRIRFFMPVLLDEEADRFFEKFLLS